MNATTPTRVTHRSTRIDAVAAAALGSAGVSMAFAGLQVVLATGAPLGEHVWGGTQDRVLPTGMRFAAAGAAVTLTAMSGRVAGAIAAAQRSWRFDG